MKPETIASYGPSPTKRIHPIRAVEVSEHERRQRRVLAEQVARGLHHRLGEIDECGPRVRVAGQDRDCQQPGAAAKIEEVARSAAPPRQAAGASPPIGHSRRECRPGRLPGTGGPPNRSSRLRSRSTASLPSITQPLAYRAAMTAATPKITITVLDPILIGPDRPVRQPVANP